MRLSRKRKVSRLAGPMRRTLLTRAPRRRRRKPSGLWSWVFGVMAALGIATYWYLVFFVVDPAHERKSGEAGRAPSPDVVARPKVTSAPAEPIDITRDGILRTAHGMVDRGVRWESNYVRIPFPGGDIAPEVGTSVDILIRALRGANIDLQLLIHRDRVAHPERYPLHRWQNKEPDTNIDHRRLPNVWAFFNRHAIRLDAGTSRGALSGYQGGDIVFWGEGKMVAPTLVGIVDDRVDASGTPYAIVLRKEEGAIRPDFPLTEAQVMGHFRIDIDRLPSSASPQTEPEQL